MWTNIIQYPRYIWTIWIVYKNWEKEIFDLETNTETDFKDVERIYKNRVKQFTIIKKIEKLKNSEIIWNYIKKQWLSW